MRVPGTPGAVDDSDAPDDERALDALVDHLRRRRVLLLADNCEHVAESVARLCSTVLASCPHVTILATSRRSLGLGGEFVIPVEPMPFPLRATTWHELTESDAGRLLVDRAQAAGARWDDDPEQVELAATLCRRLDGLPLAIELAAPRARRLSLYDLVQQFSDELEHGGGAGSPDGPLQVALRSSRAHLPAEARRAFDAMSVFSSSFTIDAALSIIGTVCPTADPLATFEMLIDHSLVDVISGTRHRYRMLETVQRFAETCRLGWADPEMAVRAHFDPVERGQRAGQWSVAAWALAFSVAPDMMWIDLTG